MAKCDQEPVVLIIDDDEMIAKYHSLVLSSFGLNSRHVVDGDSAIRACREKVFALIILDHNLRTETGDSILRRLQAYGLVSDSLVVISSSDCATRLSPFYRNLPVEGIYSKQIAPYISDWASKAGFSTLSRQIHRAS